MYLFVIVGNIHFDRANCCGYYKWGKKYETLLLGPVRNDKSERLLDLRSIRSNNRLSELSFLTEGFL